MIVQHSPSADRVSRFAARELAAYLERMTSRTVAVQASDAAPNEEAILVGGRIELGGDCFARRWENGRLSLLGSNGRSVLYAVYELLESLGCRFIAPGIETVPHLDALTLPAGNHEEAAAFAVRNIFRTAQCFRQNVPFDFLNPDFTIPQLDWLAKRRLNHFAFYVDYYRFDLWEQHKHLILDALLDRGFTIEQSYHSIHYFCPPDENFDFGHYGDASYRVHHPDWFLPAHEVGRGGWQTRVELPAVRDLITERYLDYAKRNPELEIIGLWPDDIPMNSPVAGENPADGYLPFWNHVAAALGEEIPGKRLGIIAYFELIRPPRRERPAANQQCWFCPLERNYQYPIAHEQNRHWLAPLEAWSDLCAPGQLGIFEYWGWAVSLIPFRHQAREDFRRYRDLQVGGIYGWAGFTPDILGRESRLALDLYVIAHQMWNPDADVRKLEEEWVTGMYPGAADQMLAVVDTLAKAHREEAERGIAYYFDWIGSYRWISLETLRIVQPMLADARLQAESEAIARRIDRFELICAQGATDSVQRVSTEPPPLYLENA